MALLSWLLFWVVIFVTILTLGLTLSRSRHAARVAKVCRVLAFALAALVLVGAVRGILDARETMAVVGLSAAERQRIWSNGIAELLYGAGLTAIIAVPALLTAHFALRRARG